MAPVGIVCARIVYVVHSYWLRQQGRFQLFIILIWDITGENLFIVIIVLLWLIDRGQKTCEGLKLGS